MPEGRSQGRAQLYVWGVVACVRGQTELVALPRALLATHTQRQPHFMVTLIGGVAPLFGAWVAG